MRSLLQTMINALLSADADAVVGAEWGQRSIDRVAQRNGYRHRNLDTRVGTIDVQIPKLRQGTYFPEWLLERRKRAETALITVVADCYLAGVSTRRMDKLVKTLGIHSLSKSQVSRMAADLDEHVEQFRHRPLVLVQWLAPLASEAPEFIIAVMFALRGMGAAAIGTLIASKVNQWSLLVGSLPVAHWFGGGTTALPLDGRQVEEFVLTATQTLLGVAIIIALRFHWWSTLGLAALFAVQFFVTDTTGRYVLSIIQTILAVGFLIAHRRDILPTLAAPFRRSRPESGRPVKAGAGGTS
ncbi:hypothetical protein GCM10023065_20930 [Microbacterium laevaniformans]|nr:hypothetical protein GCM10017578_26910 [Microbacterium laevaniformans]